MIQIQRHEIGGILQGFTFYSEAPISLLIHNSKYYYSVTRYRGHCDVGAPAATVQAVAFQTSEQAQEFIAQNNLVLFVVNPAHWHDPNASFRIVMSLSDNFRLLKMHPDFAQYVSNAGLISEEENGYIYVYVNFILEEHTQLFNYLNSEQGFNIQIEQKENI